MRDLIKRIEALPQPVLVGACLLSALFMGVADYLTKDISLLIFYLVPIAFATWFAGRTVGFLISCFCAVELLVCNVMLWPTGTPIASLRSWNILMEAVFLILTAHILHLLKNELEINKKRAVELEEANIELDAFNHSVSHDLRKPLSIISGFSQAILELHGEELGDDCRDYLQEIYQGTERMDDLIEALLKFSRASRCDLQHKAVDLSLIAREVTSNLQLAEPQRKVTLLIADGMTVYGDPDLFRSVLENLIGNAWKYTGQKADPVIEIGETVAGGKRTFYVRDNGSGFDMSNADRLFQPFQRLHDEKEFKGHGIGLSTVRRIIERHGGVIWAKGEVGSGATFYFSI